MNKKKYLIIIPCVMVFLFISGLVVMKKTNSDVYYNVADNGDYLVARFELNGASFIATTSTRCKNEINGCYITLPVATRDNGKVLGYSDNKDDQTSKYNIGDRLFINKNTTLYVISYQENILTIDENGVDFLAANTLSCKAYNLEKKCKVTLPSYNKIGYENKGYSTSNESLTGFIYADDEYELSKNTLMYPIYSTSSRHRPINVKTVLTYNGSFIEIENGCEENVYNVLLSYLDEIKNNTPYMLIGNKISFISDSTFDEIWGNQYVGMNYGPKTLRSVDIRCSNVVYNDYYATMVHEMAHSWDFFYAKKLGDNISSQSDIINLYNKYSNQTNRIFRDYSFSNNYEFIADMMRYYYLKYYVPRLPFSNLNYPFDLKDALEKYICISKNNYNEDSSIVG